MYSYVIRFQEVLKLVGSTAALFSSMPLTKQPWFEPATPGFQSNQWAQDFIISASVHSDMAKIAYSGHITDLLQMP